MKKFSYLIAVVAMLIVGCSKDSSTDSAIDSSTVEADIWQGELPIRQPWLRDHLPEGSLAYMRIPHPFGILATPKGNVLDPALRSTANVENLRKIQQGYIDNIVPLLPVLSEPLPRLLQQHLRSPVEVSATFLPQPAALLAANLDVSSNDEFVAVLAEAGLALAAPLDAQNMAQIDGLGMPLAVQFDAPTGRMLANFGPAVTAESFAALLVQTERNEPHRMRSLESKIDESGQGLFFWIDAKEAMSPMQMLVPRDQFQEFLDMGLDDVDAFAMGWGVANGKGRLSIAADYPSDKERGFLPNINNNFSAQSVGDPDGVILISIPTVEEYSRIEAFALSTASDEATTEWLAGKEEMLQATGISIEELLASLGPEVLFIFDRAGDYLAIRLRDEELWDSVLARIAETTGEAPDHRDVAGETIYHWALSMPTGDSDLSSLGEFSWFAELFTRTRDHSYWMLDGEFLYLSSGPQYLIDRAAMKARTDVGEWLVESQRIDPRHAVFSASGTSRKLPRRMYEMYIGILQLLADMGEAEIDIWAMPTASQLGLADVGSISFTVSLGNPTIAAEFSFENNPAELMGGMGSIAVVGILAAIAIPAYQDYSIRAQVSVGLSAAGGAKAAVSEFYSVHGRFPDGDDAVAMSTSDHSKNVESVVVEPSTGRIIINYRDIVANPDAQVVLAATPAEGRMEWSCEGTLNDKHLPAACRQ